MHATVDLRTAVSFQIRRRLLSDRLSSEVQAIAITAAATAATGIKLLSIPKSGSLRRFPAQNRTKS